MKKKSNLRFEFQFNNKGNILPNSKRSQISFEYLIIMGFVTFVIIGIMAVALFYSGGIKDRIKMTQMTNCANKIISSAESAFYAGKPSKATITCYIPEGIVNIEIDNEMELIFTIQTSTGKSATSFASNVRLVNVSSMAELASPGSRKIMLEAQNEWVDISEG